MSKVNGYTNIQTYRFCLVMDNTQYFNKSVLEYFFHLVIAEEFEEKDFDLINWNEVLERYSPQIKDYHLSAYKDLPF